MQSRCPGGASGLWGDGHVNQQQCSMIHAVIEVRVNHGPPHSGETNAAWGMRMSRFQRRSLSSGRVASLLFPFAADFLSLPSSLCYECTMRQYSAGHSPILLPVPHTRASLSLCTMHRLTALAPMSLLKPQLFLLCFLMWALPHQRTSLPGDFWHLGVGHVFAVQGCLTGRGTHSIPGVNAPYRCF